MTQISFYNKSQSVKVVHFAVTMKISIVRQKNIALFIAGMSNRCRQKNNQLPEYRRYLIYNYFSTINLNEKINFVSIDVMLPHNLEALSLVPTSTAARLPSQCC